MYRGWAGLVELRWVGLGWVGLGLVGLEFALGVGVNKFSIEKYDLEAWFPA